MLRPICGTPTRWSAPQKLAVADTIDAHVGESGMQLLAPEWERLNKQVLTCRGVR